MNVTAPVETPLYAFEVVHGRSGHRNPEEARDQLNVLWARLQGDPDPLSALERDDVEGWQFLLRYVTDGPLNIQWYERRRLELESKQRRYNGLVLTVALLLFMLAMALPFQPLLLAILYGELELAGSAGVVQTAGATELVDVAALLGVVGTGMTVALRLSAQVVRYRRQAAVFHRASAALKEQLYRIEGEWAGHPLLDAEADGVRLAPEFAAALRQAVGQAQGTLAEERDEYFDTLIVDVNALTDNTTAATESLAGTAALRSDRRHQHALEREELADALADARLAVRTTARKIEVLREDRQDADEELKFELDGMIRELRLAQQEAEQQLQYLEERARARYGG